MATLTRTRPSTEHRVALARALGVGAAVIPFLGVLDLTVKSLAVPAADLRIVFAWRLAATVFAALGWWLIKRPRVGDRAAVVVHAAALVLVAVAVTGMAVELGGPTSVYVHGMSMIMMVRASLVPAPVANTAVHGALVVVVYPLVFGVLYALDPAGHAAWATRDVLAVAATHYLFVIASVGLCCMASRASWLAHQQLFQARKLGRYRLEAPIGKGGQGEVWLARDASQKRNVALKVLRSSAATASSIKLFEREASLASQLSSPHTVRIYDFGASDDGVYYLAMEHLEGADLGALVRSHGAMPVARVLHFGIQACRSLEEAHALGMVHRDIKPSNLFAAHVDDAHDHLKLLDFGIAISLAGAGHDRHDLTRTGVVRGTPAYMAPEVARGAVAGPAADLYGLGAALYHLLAGTPPFTGEDGELIAKHLHEPAPTLASRGVVVDAGVEAVVLGCLAKQPTDRPRSATALREALEACAATHGWTSAAAQRFWTEERHGALQRWDAETAI